jgi:hypothetical protein
LRDKYKKAGGTREVGETVELSESISLVEEPDRRDGYAVRTLPKLYDVMHVAHRFTTLLSGITYFIGVSRIVVKSALLALSFPIVYPHVSTRLLLDRFPWNLVLNTFIKSRQTPYLVKIGQKYQALYMEA